MDKQAIAIIGVPMDLGQGRRGVDMGPSAIRYAGLNKRLSNLGYQIRDRGNLTVPVPEEIVLERHSGLDHLPVVADVNKRLADIVENALKDKEFPVILGGDHSIAAGSIVGICRQQRTGIIWVDAHGDYNSPQTSPSGNLHGMPLAALLGHEPQQIAPFHEGKLIKPQEVALVGVRSLDPGERKHLLEDGVNVYTIRDIDELGIAEITRRILTHFTRMGLEHIHVSFDLDALDPQIAPGVGTATPGGLNYREAHLFMEILADDERVVGLDLVELNPILDIRNYTAEMAVELAASILGQTIL